MVQVSIIVTSLTVISSETIHPKKLKSYVSDMLKSLFDGTALKKKQ
ncbi:MAG: hypothetical protein ABJN84_08880 [Flavobacteriaceae bacterium]